MIYITGDTHRDFTHVEMFCRRMNTAKKDTLIILGDAGINYYGGQRDQALKQQLSQLPITLFCIHGNHEQRPETISTYQESVWQGGTVYTEPEFSSLLFAKDGEVFDFDGSKCIVIGGAYSIDKKYRLSRSWKWWPDEQPSDEIKARVEQRLAALDWSVDVVLSHTCPLKYEPREVFISGIDERSVDKSTGHWLDTIEDRLAYTMWFCGHYHTEKRVDRLQILFEQIVKMPEF